MTTTRLSRRAALFTAAGTLAAPILLPGRALATETATDAPTETVAIPLYRRLKLGAFTVTPLLAGTSVGANPHGTFGLNASDAEFAAVSAAAFLPVDKALSSYTPVLVETGQETILFDTGLKPDGILAALKAAGKRAEDVSLVIITHMHGDHIGGLMGEQGPVFPKAKYLTGQIEYDHWAKAGNSGFDSKVKPLPFEFLQDGAQATTGVQAILAAGHTPGHMVYRLESAGQAMMLTADTANHYVWSLAHPDWEVRFDMDKPMAAATRKTVFGRIAEEKIPFIGYHMPFPAVGYAVAEGAGFRFQPASYQFDLG